MIQLVEQCLQLPLPLAKLQAFLLIHVAVHSAQFPNQKHVCGKQRPLEFLDFVSGELQNHFVVQSSPFQNGATGEHQE